MLDAQVVKLDGQVIWASAEPDLLWALRGAGGSFGGKYGSIELLTPLCSLFLGIGRTSESSLTSQPIVVTAFKLRAYPYTQSIYAGPIYLPKDSLPEIARAVADFTQRSHDEKMGMFLYVLKKELLQSIGVDQDMLVVHAYDAHGEEHGRSNEGFGWALKLKGAVDGTKPMNLRGVADLQGKMYSILSSTKIRRLTAKLGFIGQAQGLTNSYWSPLALPEMTEGLVVRAFEWFDTVSAAEGSIKDNGYLIFEVMQKVKKSTQIRHCESLLI